TTNIHHRAFDAACDNIRRWSVAERLPFVPLFAERLEKPDARVRICSAAALVETASEMRALDILTRELRSTTDEAGSRFGPLLRPFGERAVTRVIGSMNSTNRLSLPHVLSQLDLSGADSSPPLVKGLSDPDPTIQALSLDVLSQMRQFPLDAVSP